MKAGRQRLFLAVLFAAQLVAAARGAELKLSLSYAGALASDGVTPISSALDPATGLPAVNVPGSYHQYDVFMELTGLATDEDFQLLIFDVGLGSGVTPADFGGWSPNSSFVQTALSSSYSVFGANLDAGANSNDLQRIVVIANSPAGVAVLQPGESAPFRVGSALVQWDGSTSDLGSLIGLQADTLHPWGVFNSAGAQAQARSTLTIDPSVDWTPNTPPPVIVTPPAPEPVNPTPPPAEPDLRPVELPPMVEDTFDPPPAIPDPEPPVDDPDIHEPPQVFPYPIGPIATGYRIYPFPIGIPDPEAGTFTEWVVRYRDMILAEPVLLPGWGDVILNDGADRVNHDLPTEDELREVLLSVSTYSGPQWQLASTNAYTFIGFNGLPTQAAAGQVSTPEPTGLALAVIALAVASGLRRARTS